MRCESQIKEMWCRLESAFKEMRYRSATCESQIVCEMRCFTIETGAGGCESRRYLYQTAGAGHARLCSRYVRAMFAPVRLGPRCNGAQELCADYFWGMQLQLARRLITVGSRWDWVADDGSVLNSGMCGVDEKVKSKRCDVKVKSKRCDVD